MKEHSSKIDALKSNESWSMKGLLGLVLISLLVLLPSINCYSWDGNPSSNNHMRSDDYKNTRKEIKEKHKERVEKDKEKREEKKKEVREKIENKKIKIQEEKKALEERLKNEKSN
jgi:septin family protein